MEAVNARWFWSRPRQGWASHEVAGDLSPPWLRGGARVAAFVSHLAPFLLALVALVGFDAIHAATVDNDTVFAPSGEIGFSGAIMEPAGSNAKADARNAALLPYGQTIHRGSIDAVKHDPPRTVVVLPPREGSTRVVVITYD